VYLALIASISASIAIYKLRTFYLI
jgi:hypothetical protein